MDQYKGIDATRSNQRGSRNRFPKRGGGAQDPHLMFQHCGHRRILVCSQRSAKSDVERDAFEAGPSLVYSYGMNGRDEHGAGDDIVAQVR